MPDDEDGRPRTEQATATVDLPDPGRWAGQFVQAATEVAVGLRPAVQLVRWTTEDVYSRLARRGEVATRARRAGRLGSAQGPAGRPRVRSVRTCEVRDGIVEASAVVGDAERTRAVALRLEGLDGRWRVTVLELG
ncbi:MAG: 3-hydroxyacyl-CoA dehydrogenase [Actinobacteria bacterium]|nr:3-hydroxyacyl-CoA dehydrogenase [Actinomycetota bacterium]